MRSAYIRIFMASTSVCLTLFAAAPFQTMNNRKAEYSRKVDYKVAVGTWNVAGGKHIRSVLNRKEVWFLDGAKFIRTLPFSHHPLLSLHR